ncbi:hypothetical protein KQX54_014940 [Cotesia glomerata]|uniref:Uncharacterized protein n=1 Tax=Cotesia glomerata TaxID=32391 RepID=A0AAV7HSY3_COTGL|nr:hypothetical protein KQX54_014940 [Cotesia glomerata]
MEFGGSGEPVSEDSGMEDERIFNDLNESDNDVLQLDHGEDLRKKVYPQHIINNLKCLYSLQSENHPYMKETEKIITSLKAKILKVEIKITAWSVNKLESNIDKMKESLKKQSDKERRLNTCVFNFTDVQLPKEVEGILNLEPGFGIPLTPRQVPVGVLIKDLENGLRFLDIAGSDFKTVKEEQSNIRSKVVYYNLTVIGKMDN